MVSAPFDCFDQNGYDIGFFFCFKDPLNCLFVYCCPCLAIGRLRGQIEGKDFDFLSCCCALLGAYRNRRKVQDMYNHHESEDATMLAVTCCPCCAITQDCHEYAARTGDKKEEAPAAVAEPSTN